MQTYIHGSLLYVVFYRSCHLFTYLLFKQVFFLFYIKRKSTFPSMAQDTFGTESHQRHLGRLKNQVRFVKRKDSERYEVSPIQDQLSFENGFFIVFHACQLLVQKNDGMILVGVAGPSGAGKTVFTEKILNFMPDIAVISMDNYNDSSRIVDGNFDGKLSFDLFLCDALAFFLWCIIRIKRHST